MAAGTVYLVGTPIGNLDDISVRALRVLKEVDLIAAEDTRHTGVLLSHFEIKKPLVSYHQFNEARRTSELLQQIEEGRSVALVSDAGMPCLSDPGERLVRACQQAAIRIEVIPGASAVLVALLGSGFATVPFYFGGFLPIKTLGRRNELLRAAERDCTSVYFESPHRILRALEDAAAVIPQIRLCVARELTKKFEEWRQGRAEELGAHYGSLKVRGEFCLLVEGSARRRSSNDSSKDRVENEVANTDSDDGGIDSQPS